MYAYTDTYVYIHVCAMCAASPDSYEEKPVWGRGGESFAIFPSHHFGRCAVWIEKTEEIDSFVRSFSHFLDLCFFFL